MAALDAERVDDLIEWPSVAVDPSPAIPTMNILVSNMVAAGVEDPRPCARAIVYLYGPGVTFAHVGAPPGTYIGPRTVLDENARSGVIPAHVRSAAAFSTTVLPAWVRENPEYSLGGNRAAAVRDALPEIVRDRDTVRAQQRRDIRRLIAMGETRDTITAAVLAIPDVPAATQYVGAPVWERIVQVLQDHALGEVPSHAPVKLGEFRWLRHTDDCKEVGVDPLVNKFSSSFAEMRLAPDLLHNVHSLYQAMDPRRYFAMTHIGLDYAVAIPPADDRRVRVPGAFSFPLHSTRERWLGEMYELHLRHSLSLTLCVAHNEFLAGLLELPANLSPQMRRARSVLTRIVMREFAATMDAEILDQCMRDVVHPSVAYTHAVHKEEVRYWIWCALENVYTDDCLLAMSQRATGGTNEARRRMHDEMKWAKKFSTALKGSALSPADIVTGVLHSGKISEAWLTEVYDQWMVAHDTTDLDIVLPIGTNMWMDALRDEARKRGAIGNAVTLDTFQTALDDITRIVLARFILYTFYETRQNFGVVRDAVISEIVRQSTPQYAVYIGQLPQDAMATEDLNNYLASIWLPLVAHWSSPSLLYAIHEHLVGLDIIPRRDGPDGRVEAASIESSMRDNPALGDAPPPEIAALPANALARFVVREYRDKIAALNWYTAFFEKWTVRNAAELRGRMSFAARLDGHEHLAFLLSITTRGRIMSIPMTIPTETLLQGRFAVPAEAWPLYRTWSRTRVRWNFVLSFDKGATAAYETSIEYDVIMRVLSPLEISGSSVLGTLCAGYACVPPCPVMLTITCTVHGILRTTARIAATENVRASSTCVLFIPDYGRVE